MPKVKRLTFDLWKSNVDFEHGLVNNSTITFFSMNKLCGYYVVHVHPLFFHLIDYLISNCRLSVKLLRKCDLYLYCLYNGHVSRLI